MAGNYIDPSFIADVDWRKVATIERMPRSDYRKLVQATIPERFPSDDCVCRGEGPRVVLAGTSQYFDEYDRMKAAEKKDK